MCVEIKKKVNTKVKVYSKISKVRAKVRRCLLLMYQSILMDGCIDNGRMVRMVAQL